MCKLTQVLHDLEKLNHKTLWKEAQELLLDEPVFNDDSNLQESVENGILEFSENGGFSIRKRIWIKKTLWYALSK